MKSTWKLLNLVDGPNCRCLICGKGFTFLADGHFNMRLVKCLTCNQQVWVPRCPNGCPSFDLDPIGDVIKFNIKETTDEDEL